LSWIEFLFGAPDWIRFEKNGLIRSVREVSSKLNLKWLQARARPGHKCRLMLGFSQVEIRARIKSKCKLSFAIKSLKETRSSLSHQVRLTSRMVTACSLFSTASSPSTTRNLSTLSSMSLATTPSHGMPSLRAPTLLFVPKTST
jgi:hypothetical protein